MPPISNTTSTSPIKKEVIAFENNREATAVFPSANAPAEEIIKALELKAAKAVLLIIGGADSVDEKVKLRLIQLFGRGIARAAVNLDAVILDGGTDAGVMAMMGQGVADRGSKSSLIGVAPLGMVTYPGSDGAGETPLDPNHSHFVLVEGKAWGAETSVMYKLVSGLTCKAPGLVLLAGGGTISKKEVLQAVRHNLPLIVIEGSGGFADEIAAAWKSRPDLLEDPVMAEIIADGRIEFHLLSNSVNGAERLIIRELGGDNVLLHAWEQFADYDLNAGIQQTRFNRLQIAIVIIGVLGTALALIKQVWIPDGVLPTSLKDWWFYWPTSPVVTPYWVGWWVIYYVLLTIPIVLTVLITAANRFKQGNKWLLLRAGAEAIKREIYRYRTRSGAYQEKPKESPAPTPSAPAAAETTTPASTTTPAATTPATATSATPPPPTPEQVLAQRVEDITRRIMRTEVNASALIPYDKGKGFPPYMYAAEGGDDGFSLLSPDRYVEVRLRDQLRYFKKTAFRLERQLKVFQYAIFIVGGLGTFLAAINQQVWIALTTALAAAFTTYLSYRQTETSLTKYNQAATDLANVKAWWTALPAEEQAKPENVNTLVRHTEQVLESELDGWVQQMQNSLAELRKSQTPASESAEPKGGKESESNEVKTHLTTEATTPTEAEAN